MGCGVKKKSLKVIITENTKNHCHKAQALYSTDEANPQYSVSFSLHFDWLDPLKSFLLADWNSYHKKLPSLIIFNQL